MKEKLTGLLIVNNCYTSPDFEACFVMLIEEFEKIGIEVLITPNKEFTVSLQKTRRSKKTFALFWDKDVLYAEKLGFLRIPCFNDAEAVRLCDDKLLATLHLSQACVPVPNTIAAPFIYANIGYRDYDFINNKLDFPLVVKSVNGSLGEQVFIARNCTEAIRFIKQIFPARAVLQEYIPGDDIRVFVVGNKALGAMARAPYRKYGADKLIFDTAVAAARAVGCDFAGVDIMVKDGKPYVLEVNSAALFNKFYNVTGINPAQYIAEYVKTTLSRNGL